MKILDKIEKYFFDRYCKKYRLKLSENLVSINKDEIRIILTVDKIDIDNFIYTSNGCKLTTNGSINIGVSELNIAKTKTYIRDCMFMAVNEINIINRSKNNETP